MLPIPSRAAIAAFIGCVLMLAVGMALRSAAAVSVAGAGFVGLAWALALTMPLGRRMRAERLEFAWWLEHGAGRAAGAAVPGAPFEVRCYVRHRGPRAVEATELEPLMSAAARLDACPRAIRLEGSARTEFRIRLTAPAAGRLVLHGLALRLRGPLGLFDTPLYFPNPLAINVLPRAAAGRPRAETLRRRAPTTRAGRAAVRHRGGGTEFHELRELVPGDPFKSIAWKASARRGRLMVKEVEQELQQTRWVVLDVSGTMRAGPPGRRKLDFGIEAAAAEAFDAVAGGDRVGFVTVDARLVAYVGADEGKPQLVRIYDALLGCTEIVDEDLTDIDDRSLATLVARYVRQQDGVDFLRGAEVDVPGLVDHVRRSLGSTRAADTPVQARTPAGQWLRRFCRARALALPHRSDTGDHRKSLALADALQRVGGRSRSPASILVCTDFDGVHDPAPLVSALRLVRAHGHRVAFVLPDARTFAPPASDPLAQTLTRVYARSEERRLREARALLGRLGVVAIVANHGGSPALVVEQARHASTRRAA